jgi:hypothetical protein
MILITSRNISNETRGKIPKNSFVFEYKNVGGLRVADA